MKKVTIACLASDRQDTVTSMQRLGTVHVTPLVAPSSDELDRLLREQENLGRVLATFKSLKVSADAVETDAAASLAEALEILSARKQLEDELAQANKACQQLAPWGSFDQDAIARLAERGLHVHPASVSRFLHREGKSFKKNGSAHRAVAAKAQASARTVDPLPNAH